mmetsp:Transcript_108009/g.311310  ORF Transcript_108009/g.311310 Transcript_108009/m.311310 type:complete len:124 (+) Transcript_108009:223-594(+)
MRRRPLPLLCLSAGILAPREHNQFHGRLQRHPMRIGRVLRALLMHNDDNHNHIDDHHFHEYLDHVHNLDDDVHLYDNNNHEHKEYDHFNDHIFDDHDNYHYHHKAQGRVRLQQRLRRAHRQCV